MVSTANFADRELSSGEEQAFQFAADCLKAEKSALRLIARAEQNSLGLTAKLERRRFDAAVVKTVVDRFLEQNLLDNGRYAERWIRSRLSCGKAVSPQWLLVNLAKRGISREDSRKALAKVLDPETEYALLVRYLEKTGLDKTFIPDNTEYTSLRAKLKYEGFSFDILDKFFDDFHQN